ncbi:MAG TPA: hypothetical protein PLS26_07275 [Bacteroidales bacterium]|nr:hypothetical protein [Bacteroidales bacterium]
MEMTVYEFFDLVYSGELGTIDIYNYVKEVTNNFEIQKLKLLKYDIEYCYSCEKEEKEDEFSQVDIENAIDRLKKQNREIPYYYRKEMKNKNGEVVFPECKILNKEKLLFPFDFFCVHQLLGLIEKLIKEYDTQPGTKNKTKVKAFWKQSKKSLKKFHSLLQNEYKFIDEIEQDVFISHFDGTATPETPKINWNDEQTVFVRLFDTINFCFDKKYLHTTDKTVSVAELSKHFTINGAKTDSKKLRQTRNTIKGIETKMELEIRNISKELEKTL